MIDHGGDVFEISNKIGISPNNIIDFSSNINPYGPPPKVIEVIKSSLHLIKYYPDKNYSKLRKAIANYVNLPCDNIIVGCGVTELIHSILTRFFKKSVVIPTPTFSEYEVVVKALGLKAIFIEPIGIKINLEKILDIVKNNEISGVILCNPNNPTGEILDYEKIIEIIEIAEKKGIFVIVDEAYYELSENSKTFASLTLDFRNLFVLRSLTKAFGFPGLRVGYALCHSSLAEKFNQTAISWRIGTLEELAAISALEDLDFLKYSKKKIFNEKEKLFNNIKSINGLVPIPSSTNFFMININKSGFSPKNLKWRLLSYAILIRELSSVRGLNEPYIRIAVRKEEENLVLIKALKNIIYSMKKLYPNNPICIEKKCHLKVEDCSFCFCHFYPCLDNITGGKFIERENGRLVWSCTDCIWIHRKDVVNLLIKKLVDIDAKKVDPEEILKKRKEVLEVIPP
jgi:L-threonine-O-3-phosphate decarboxylase